VREASNVPGLYPFRATAYLAVLLAGCGGGRSGILPAPRSMALARLQGCYVVHRRQQLSGDSLEADFPFFFGLDTTPSSRGGEPAYRVRLPLDDVTRWAPGWTWIPDSAGAEIEVTAAASGYRLRLHPDSAGWRGRLLAWNGAEQAEFELAGPRTPCPEGVGQTAR